MIDKKFTLISLRCLFSSLDPSGWSWFRPGGKDRYTVAGKDTSGLPAPHLLSRIYHHADSLTARHIWRQVSKIIADRFMPAMFSWRFFFVSFANGLSSPFKGILHQKIFYCLNLIFWIVMGCGIARFGRRGLKATETWKFWSQILSLGVLRRGAPGILRHSAMGFGGAAQGFRGTARWGFEAQRHGVSRGGALIKHFSDLSFCAVLRGPIRLAETSRDSAKW